MKQRYKKKKDLRHCKPCEKKPKELKKKNLCLKAIPLCKL